MTYYILCTIIYISFLILYLYHVSFHVVATRPCYTIHFLHIVLSYIFLYDLVLSYTLHLRFYSDYRIGIHDRFERESRHVCHSLYFHLVLFIYYTFLLFLYIVLSYYLSYTFRVIDTLFLVLVYLSYTFLFHILYLFIYFSCTILCTLCIPYTVIYSSLSFSYTFMYYVLFMYCHISYTVILYFTSCSCNCLLSLHSSTMLLISYHIFYTFHLHILVIFF